MYANLYLPGYLRLTDYYVNRLNGRHFMRQGAGVGTEHTGSVGTSMMFSPHTQRNPTVELQGSFGYDFELEGARSRASNRESEYLRARDSFVSTIPKKFARKED